jgi:hypothetical protein
VKNAYNQVQRIAVQIEDRSGALATQRREIEARLNLESKEYSADLNDVKTNIEGFREKFSAKSSKDYNLTIDSLKEKLKMLTEKQAMINKKHADLEFAIEEFPLLDQCKKNIKPFEEFWKTFDELARNEEYWY